MPETAMSEELEQSALTANSEAPDQRHLQLAANTKAMAGPALVADSVTLNLSRQRFLDYTYGESDHMGGGGPVN